MQRVNQMLACGLANCVYTTVGKNNLRSHLRRNFDMKSIQSYKFRLVLTAPTALHEPTIFSATFVFCMRAEPKYQACSYSNEDI